MIGCNAARRAYTRFGTETLSYIHQIVEYLRKAQHLATEKGYTNLLQPGMVKELIIGDILKHEVHTTKHEPDAWDPANPDDKFEYLCCAGNRGTFQLDRMFKHPPDKREKSLTRITRNKAFFCAIFNVEQPLDVEIIYEVPVDLILAEVERQLNASRNDISHIGLTVKWCERVGKVVYKRAS